MGGCGNDVDDGGNDVGGCGNDGDDGGARGWVGREEGGRWGWRRRLCGRRGRR